jgi:predicted RNA-binding protein
MCLAQVEFVDYEEERRPSALSEVAWIERTPAGLRITDLLGRVTQLEADIRCIDFVRSVVCVEHRASTPAGQE